MAPFDGCSFPLARVLIVTLYINPKDDSALERYDGSVPTISEDYPAEAAASTAAFVRRLKQMALGINEVDVEVLDEQHENILLEGCSAHDRELCRQLFGLPDSLVAFTPGRVSLVKYRDLEPLRSLVCIDYSVGDCADEIVSMVRRNTQTLQVLSISVGRLEHVTSLINDKSTGGYLEYPYLHTLKSNAYWGSTAPKKPAFPGTIPFPHLRHLTLWSDYPFGDDTVFRGNVATLVTLDMELNKPLVTILCKNEVFTPNSHPKLHGVAIDLLEKHELLPTLDLVSYISFVATVGSKAPVRQFGMPQIGGALLSLTSVHASLACIQVLALTHTPVELWDVFSLLKALPLLSDLTTLAPKLGKLPVGITKANLPDHVTLAYVPVGVRFRCWRVYSCSFRDFSEIA
ncbi:hypothetical protein GGI06_003614, partial [Coemansia sp. S85]